MKKFYNTYDASMVFGVMPETVRRWRKEGKINGEKNGPRNRIMFSRSDMLDFMRDNPKYGKPMNYVKLVCYPHTPTKTFIMGLYVQIAMRIKLKNELRRDIKMETKTEG